MSILNMVKDPTCFKNSENRSFVDLVLTSNVNFQNSSVIETGLSDLHNMIVAFMKITFQKLQSKIIYFIKIIANSSMIIAT